MRETSHVLRDSLHQGSTAARITGNEFLLLLENIDIDAGVAMADRLYARLSRPLSIDGHDAELEICMGLAVYPGDGDSA